MEGPKGVVVMSESNAVPSVNEIFAKLEKSPEVFDTLNSGDVTGVSEIFEFLGARSFTASSQVIKE